MLWSSIVMITFTKLPLTSHRPVLETLKRRLDLNLELLFVSQNVFFIYFGFENIYNMNNYLPKCLIALPLSILISFYITLHELCTSER